MVQTKFVAKVVVVVAVVVVVEGSFSKLTDKFNEPLLYLHAKVVGVITKIAGFRQMFNGKFVLKPKNDLPIRIAATNNDNDDGQFIS